MKAMKGLAINKQIGLRTIALSSWLTMKNGLLNEAGPVW